MKVTIDEARVGKQPILKIDGIELANIVNGEHRKRVHPAP